MLLHHEFVKNAKKLSKKLAIIDRTTEKRITYSKALLASLILAKKIKKYRDGFIGIMIPNSAGSVLTVIAVIMAGKVPVMINYSTGAAENSEYAQAKCGFRTIITSRALLEKIGCRIVKGMVFIEDFMEKIGVTDKVGAVLHSALPLKMLLKSIHRGDENDNAVILFTSGSEKDPKAVQLTHKNLGSNIEGIFQRIDINDDDIMLANLPFFHVFGHNTNLWLPLVRGLTLVSYANPLEYAKMCKIVRDEGVTLMLGTPVFFMGYLRKSEPGDFKNVRLAVAGADKTPDWLREGFKEKHNVDLFEGYGATETSPVVSLNVAGMNRPGSIGKPLDNVKVKIRHIDTDEDLPPGKEGKIVVKGDLIMKGYFDDLEETSIRIKDGWYDTGDMGLLDEQGYLWHRGRLKRFVKIGGEMVSLVKVETVLTDMLPDGIDCCVVEVPDSVKGAKIVAAVTGEIQEKKILKKMAKELPPIAVPRKILLVEDLPKMGSGKIDFRATTIIVRERLKNGD